MRLNAPTIQPILAWTLALALWAVSFGARAESYNIGVPIDLNFGRLTSAATGTSTSYTLNATTNTVSPNPGSAGAPTATRGKVTISCSAAANTCKGKKITISLSAPGNTQNGRLGRISAFNAYSDNMTITTSNGVNGALNISVNSFPATGSGYFYVGATAPVNSNATGGGTGQNYTTPYTVSVTSSSGSLNTYSANAKATLLRGLSVTKNSDLAFGIVVRPASGTGTVTMSPSSPFPTATNGAIWLDSTSPLAAVSRAKYTVTGEGGTSVSVQIATPNTATIPAPNGYFTMNGPAGSTPITVTTTTDVSATKSLGAVLGAEGSFSFFVGGAFNVPSTLKSGTYSGTFNVVVNYQ